MLPVLHAIWLLSPLPAVPCCLFTRARAQLPVPCSSPPPQQVLPQVAFQAECASSYAFAVAAALESKLMIQSGANATATAALSAQYIMVRAGGAAARAGGWVALIERGMAVLCPFAACPRCMRSIWLPCLWAPPPREQNLSSGHEMTPPAPPPACRTAPPACSTTPAPAALAAR